MIVLVGLLGSASSCFTAPNAPVQFSCDPGSAPECPPDYTCFSDGCCHRDGSDVDAHLGECRLGPSSGTGSDSSTTIDTDAMTGTTDASTTEASTTDVASSTGEST
jgi:hypothetical protein